MQQLDSIFCETLKATEKDLDDASSMETIPGWDSLSHMDLITEIESTFSIQLTGDEIADMRDLGSIRKIISQHVSI